MMISNVQQEMKNYEEISSLNGNQTHLIKIPTNGCEGHKSGRNHVNEFAVR